MITSQPLNHSTSQPLTHPQRFKPTFIPILILLLFIRSQLILIFIFLSKCSYIYIYIKYGVGGVWAQLLGGQGARAYVILVLRECIWNAPAVSAVLLAFDNTGSLGSPPRQTV